MPRRDQLTYDVELRRQRDVPWASVLLLVAVVFVVAVLIAWMVNSRTSQPGSAGPAVSRPVSSSSVVPVPTPTPSTPTSSPAQTGSDLNEGVSAPEGSQQAASRFVVAWLDRNPTTRKAALTQTAAPALVEQLMLTDVANIPLARAKGVPALNDASAYSAQFTQVLTTGMSIRVYLVADPQARYRWVATSVDRA